MIDTLDAFTAQDPVHSNAPPKARKGGGSKAAAKSAAKKLPKDHGKGYVMRSVRLRPEDARRMEEIRYKEGITAQQQFLTALGMLFERYGYPVPENPLGKPGRQPASED